MTAAPLPVGDHLAAEANALARWAELCAVADQQDQRMRWGQVVRLDEAGGDEPATEPR